MGVLDSMISFVTLFVKTIDDFLYEKTPYEKFNELFDSKEEKERFVKEWHLVNRGKYIFTKDNGEKLTVEIK